MAFKILLVSVLTYFVGTVEAYDSEKLDGILDNLEEAIIDSDRASLLISDIDNSKSKFSVEQKARFLLLQGTRELINGNYKKSLIYFENAESLHPSNSLQVSIFLQQATAYVSLLEYQKALDVMSLNSLLVDNLKNMEQKGKVYIRLAGLYLSLQAYEEVKKYSLKASRFKEKLSLKNQCHSKLYFAVSKLKLNKLDGATSAFKDSSEFCKVNGFPLVGAMSMKGLGMVELERGNYLKALELFVGSLNNYQIFQYQLEINHIHALLAETYLGLKQPLKAKEYASFVISLPNETKNLEFKEIAMKVMSELSYQAGDYKQAYDYFVLHQDLSNTLLDDTKAKANAYQMAKFENGEKTREIHLLNKDRELYTAKAELTELQRNNERMMFLLICGSFIVLTLFAINMTLQKRKYKNLAQFDVLTGIYNRGTGQDKAENRYVKDSISGVNFSVILFDLDHFKNINDSYGHAMGDWVLKKVCEVVSIECRSGDIFTRFGGEEFALFMSNTDNDTAKKVAEKCRAQILAIETRYSGHEFTISASFGVATSTVKDLSLDPIIQRADVAMYQSKEHGRDRVSVYSSEVT
ncbi:diguanylate cyclase [Shewanella hanedai]|uniref:diguanylate cyclase n=1 Tax=Shewanella hanedai TaxID=25 RepID=A0A553JTG9_SHEHA|nr:diguanylate cyclase [Shewanella hanedai]